MTTSVSNFYSRLAFPGYYKLDQLTNYGTPIENRYLELINSKLGSGLTVLDAGCGTGLTTNLFAIRNPDSRFVGVDFSDSVKWAANFAQTNNITNAEFKHCDLTEYSATAEFDRVICQGVLHHIPNWIQAIANLRNAVKPDGLLILGLYHPAGKLLKRFVNINYNSSILHTDQENNPFELSFSLSEVIAMTPGFKLLSAAPHILNNITIPAFFNYKNGGLTLYTLKRIK